METKTDYIEAYRAEYASSKYGSLKIKVLIDIPRELTEDDNSNLRNAMEGVYKSLVQETIKLDPESAEAAQRERKEILELFGDEIIYVEEIPNGYCSDYCCKHLPWFIVTTRMGRIKIGWRKRVISIDWSDSTISIKAQALFPDEDVTKEGRLIHVGSYEKARAYIKILMG